MNVEGSVATDREDMTITKYSLHMAFYEKNDYSCVWSPFADFEFLPKARALFHFDKFVFHEILYARDGFKKFWKQCSLSKATAPPELFPDVGLEVIIPIANIIAVCPDPPDARFDDFSRRERSTRISFEPVWQWDLNADWHESTISTTDDLPQLGFTKLRCPNFKFRWEVEIIKHATKRTDTTACGSHATSVTAYEPGAGSHSSSEVDLETRDTRRSSASAETPDKERVQIVWDVSELEHAFREVKGPVGTPASDHKFENEAEQETRGLVHPHLRRYLAALEAEYELAQEKVKIHNEAVQAGAINDSAAVPRARTADPVEAPQRTSLHTYLTDPGITTAPAPMYKLFKPQLTCLCQSHGACGCTTQCGCADKEDICACTIDLQPEEHPRDVDADGGEAVKGEALTPVRNMYTVGLGRSQPLTYTYEVPRSSSPSRALIYTYEVPRASSPDRALTYTYEVPRASSPDRALTYTYEVPRASSHDRALTYTYEIPPPSSPSRALTYTYEVPRSSSPLGAGRETSPSNASRKSLEERLNVRMDPTEDASSTIVKSGYELEDETDDLFSDM